MAQTEKLDKGFALVNGLLGAVGVVQVADSLAILVHQARCLQRRHHRLDGGSHGLVRRVWIKIGRRHFACP